MGDCAIRKSSQLGLYGEQESYEQQWLAFTCGSCCRGSACFDSGYGGLSEKKFRDGWKFHGISQTGSSDPCAACDRIDTGKCWFLWISGRAGA